MPELVEVEAYRRLAERVVGRTVEAVVAPDAWYLKGGLSARAAADAWEGRRVVGARRQGKLLLVDLVGPDGPAPTLGLRFGMTGRLVVDGEAGVGKLLTSSAEVADRWDRFALRFGLPQGGDLRMQDPRRLGGVSLDPAVGRLGPDALNLGLAALRVALGASQAPLKARLLDQSRVAGVGNLAADEALWRAGLDPARPAGSLDAADLRRLHRHLRATMADLLERGGSNRGDLQPERRPGGRCPRDATPLARTTVGGRTTWWCPTHQH